MGHPAHFLNQEQVYHQESADQQKIDRREGKDGEV
jgi:hypothetical protein